MQGRGSRGSRGAGAVRVQCRDPDIVGFAGERGDWNGIRTRVVDRTDERVFGRTTAVRATGSGLREMRVYTAEMASPQAKKNGPRKRWAAIRWAVSLAVCPSAATSCSGLAGKSLLVSPSLLSVASLCTMVCTPRTRNLSNPCSDRSLGPRQVDQEAGGREETRRREGSRGLLQTSRPQR